jgi:hypothetical protein
VVFEIFLAFEGPFGGFCYEIISWRLEGMVVMPPCSRSFGANINNKWRFPSAVPDQLTLWLDAA